MRFELKFVAVVCNVAVMANVAIQAVERFVARYLLVHHAMLGRGTTSLAGSLRARTPWCDPCLGLSSYRWAATGLALAAISPPGEIFPRMQAAGGCSKRRIADAITTFGKRD